MIITQKQLDETDKKILDHIKNGYRYKEISQRIYVSVDTIKYRVKMMKNLYSCKTLPELLQKAPEISI